MNDWLSTDNVEYYCACRSLRLLQPNMSLASGPSPPIGGAPVMVPVCQLHVTKRLWNIQAEPTQIVGNWVS